MPPISTHLSRLESSALIRLAQLEPEIEYLFRHALVQEAVYAALLKEDRKAIHRDVAQAIERVYPERAEEAAAVLAHHYAAAGDETQALHYYIAAGDGAARRYANAEALRQYAAALDIEKKSPDGKRLSYLYVQIGHSLEHSGDYAAALRHYLVMAEAARRRTDRSLELAALMAQATIRATSTSVHDPAEAKKLLDAALTLSRELGDRAAESTVLWNLMLFHKFAGHGALAVEHGEASLAIARELNLREQMAYSMNDLITHGYLDAGNVRKARELVDQVPALWEELNNLPMLADSHSSAAIVHFLLGEYDESIRTAEQARRISESIHNLWGESYSRWVIGQVYADRGEVGKAVQTMEECVALGDQAGFVGATVGVSTDLAYLYGWLGLFEEGQTAARRALDAARVGLASWLGWPMAVSICLDAWRGDLDAARAGLAEIERAVSDSVFMEFPLSVLYLDLARVQVGLALGELPAVRRALDHGDEYFARTEIRAYRPDALYLRARAFLAEGRQAEALSALKEAHAAATALGSRRVLWQIESALWKLTGKETHLKAARQHITFIADHARDDAMRRTFLALPEVATVMNA